MKKYPAILSAFYNQPLLVHLNKAKQISQFIDSRVAGEPSIGFTGPESAPTTEYFSADGEQVDGGQLPSASANRSLVAILPVFGTMFQHGGLEMESSGGTSTESIAREFRSLASEPSIKTIILHTHSPGGQVWGTQELSDLIRSVRESGETRVVSSVNSQAASAALWVCSAANEVYVTPGGELGSIGVLTFHRDISGAESQEGIHTTIIATPEKKIERNPYGPLSEGARATIEGRLAYEYQRFVSAMAINRNVSSDKVVRDFGGGGMLNAEDSVSAGLADGVATFHDVLSEEVGRLRQVGRKSMRARMKVAAANG